MPYSFTDLVFAGERIEVGLRRGKFDYATSTSTNNRRFGASGAKKKEGDAHTVTSAPTWPKTQQTPHNTYQYAPHQPSFSANVGNPPKSAFVQQKSPAQPQRNPPQNSFAAPSCYIDNSNPSTSTNSRRNFSTKKPIEFTPIPMSYAHLLLSLITHQMAMVSPRKIYQSSFPRWYNPYATYAYHGGVSGHSIEQCVALKHKVKSLIDAGWLTFQDDSPNVRTNPLPSHGESAVNVVEECGPQRPK